MCLSTFQPLFHHHITIRDKDLWPHICRTCITVADLIKKLVLLLNSGTADAALHVVHSSATKSSYRTKKALLMLYTLSSDTNLENSKVRLPHNYFGSKMSMQCTLKMQSSLQAIEFPSV